MHKATSANRSLCRSPLLSLFFQEIISDRQLVRRGNPRFPMARQSEKQRKPSLFSLFPAVHVDKRID